MDAEGERAEAGIGADIAGGLFPADMLLAGRKREDEAALARGIHGFAAQPPRHLAEEFLPGREQAHIGTAEIKPIADRLAFTGDDVGALRARRFQQALSL